MLRPGLNPRTAGLPICRVIRVRGSRFSPVRFSRQIVLLRQQGVWRALNMPTGDIYVWKSVK